jgi:hypothetical protein
MGDEIILTKLDDEAERIIDAFEERTGLEGEDEGDHRRFELVNGDHAIDVVQTLDAIDDDWPEHVGFQEPQG